MNVYELLANGYVLLDAGVLTMSVVKLLALTLLWHLLVKAIPPAGRRRAFGAALLGALLVPLSGVSLQADLRESWVVLGHHFLITRDEPKALAAFTSAWDAGERRSVIYRQMMTLYCRQDRQADSLMVASEAVRLFPHEQGILLTAAEVHLFSRDFSTAIELARRAVVDDADLGLMMRGYHVWAKALVHSGRAGEAVAVVREEQGRLPSPEARELLEQEIRSLQNDAVPVASESTGGQR